jgi:arylsulfatase A-like enzyme
MATRPNILFLMTDQMQARLLEPGHPCITPGLDRLAATGLRFTRAHTPSPVCCPARASLMTGLYPHAHGVVENIHGVDDDQCNLRLDKPHWAPRLAEAGYRTGYFGKWHVERSARLADFGWQVHAGDTSPRKGQIGHGGVGADPPRSSFRVHKELANPPGYKPLALYGVTDLPVAERGLGDVIRRSREFLGSTLRGADPWCCFVSTLEPHDPFYAGRDAFEKYDLATLPIPPNADDDLADKTGICRKVAEVFRSLTERERKEALACYYAATTEVDEQFGALIRLVEEAGRRNDTIIVMTSDHGDMAGGHGHFTKGVCAFEELYQVPLIFSGPGIATGKTTKGRVGLHDLGSTLLELCGLPPLPTNQSRSFARLLADPAAGEAAFTTGFAEFHGTRYKLSHRVVWDDDWKYVLNGFDYDEMYDLADDPGEMRNLARDPAHQGQARRLLARLWAYVRETDDHTLLNSHYPGLRAAPFGPLIAPQAR